MRAALIAEIGRPPQVGEAPEPAGESLEVLAAPVNPLDRAVAAGRFYGGHPPLPYVPGCECVGREAAAGSSGRRRRTRPGAERDDGGAPSRARSSSRCLREPTRRSRRRWGSPASPAGCRSHGVLPSDLTTACSCSARPGGRPGGGAGGETARRRARGRGRPGRSGPRSRASWVRTTPSGSTGTSVSRRTSIRSAASRSSEPSRRRLRARASSSSASRRRRRPR